ncbi:HEPN domain-containing protein [Brevundimonas intermedia]|uniref:HEPN domain-containing protein n=1 Tax=Brevundimonas intermedia TaxID=74315 RepID=UPI003208834C
MNAALRRGEYFWTDIVRDGIALYEIPGHPFPTPQPMTAQAAAEMADRHFEAKAADLRRWIDTAEYQTGRAATDEGFRKLAAFSLHQAVETAYACFLLVHTFYFPRSHNIKFLRSLAEDVNTSLVETWPRESRFDRRRFELLKRAYVEARYSDQYDGSSEDLEWLMARARCLRDRVTELGKARIEELKVKAGSAG